MVIKIVFSYRFIIKKKHVYLDSFIYRFYVLRILIITLINHVYLFIYHG
jgi:hypothetical protein